MMMLEFECCMYVGEVGGFRQVCTHHSTFDIRLEFLLDLAGKVYSLNSLPPTSVNNHGSHLASINTPCHHPEDDHARQVVPVMPQRLHLHQRVHLNGPNLRARRSLKMAPVAKRRGHRPRSKKLLQPSI